MGNDWDITNWRGSPRRVGGSTTILDLEIEYLYRGGGGGVTLCIEIRDFPHKAGYAHMTHIVINFKIPPSFWTLPCCCLLTDIPWVHGHVEACTYVLALWRGDKSPCLLASELGLPRRQTNHIDLYRN